MKFVTNLFTAEDAANIDQILRKYASPNMIAFELGSFTGKSTLIIAPCIHENQGHLFCVDWFKGTIGSEGVYRQSYQNNNILEIFRENIREAGFEDDIDVLIGTTESIAAIVADDTADFIFVDADHRYSSVQKDLITWYPKLKKGGVLCGHDFEKHLNECDWNSVLQHCEEGYVDGCHYGVSRAVCEFFPDVQRQGRIWYTIKDEPSLLLKTSLLANQRRNPKLIRQQFGTLLQAAAGVQLVEENYQGFNIVRYGWNFYGIPSADGDVDLIHIDEESLNSRLRDRRVVVGETFYRVKQQIDTIPYSVVPQTMEEGYKGFNLVFYHFDFHAISQELGPFDLASIDAGTTSKLTAQYQYLAGNSIESLKQQIDAVPYRLFPELIEEGYKGYNLVLYRYDYHAISQKLGPFDLVSIDDRFKAELTDQHFYLVGNSITDLKQQIDAITYHLIPQLLEEGYRGYNLVYYHYGFHALSQDIGPIDLGSMDDATRSTLASQYLYVAGNSIEDLNNKINDLLEAISIHLIDQDYYGYQVFSVKGNCFGLSHLLSIEDLEQADQATLTNYMESEKIFVAPTSAEVNAQILTYLVSLHTQGSDHP